jgi:hypothetical protein
MSLLVLNLQILERSLQEWTISESSCPEISAHLQVFLDWCVYLPAGTLVASFEERIAGRWVLRTSRLPNLLFETVINLFARPKSPIQNAAGFRGSKCGATRMHSVPIA